MIDYFPSDDEYREGFEAVDAVVQADGALEAAHSFRDKYRSMQAVDANLQQAAFQLLNLETYREREMIDKKRAVTRVAFMGYTFGQMVNEQVYPDFLQRMSRHPYGNSKIADPEKLEQIRTKIKAAGGIDTRDGGLWATIALGQDGMSRIGEPSEYVAQRWRLEVEARTVVPEQIAEENLTRLEIAFGVGLGYSLNKAYWRFDQADRLPAIVVTPVWYDQA